MLQSIEMHKGLTNLGIVESDINFHFSLSCNFQIKTFCVVTSKKIQTFYEYFYFKNYQ